MPLYAVNFFEERHLADSKMKGAASGHYSMAMLIPTGAMVVETSEKRKHATYRFEK